jgi:uncharacterized protein (TIGR02147 family)
MDELPDIFAFLSHRDWLREAWQRRKAKDPRFSHRWIARRVGFSSSSMFSDILKGGRHITPAVAMRLAKVFALAGTEIRYFELLVLHDQAESEEERRVHLERLVRLRRTRVPALESGQMELFSRWWNLAVRELLDTYPCDGDPKDVASRVAPPLKPDQARRSLDLLARLGLAERGDDGIWRKKESVLTADGSRHQQVRDFQREALRLGLEAMDRFPSRDADTSTLTLSISRSTLDSIRARLAEVRREILEMARNDSLASRVVQLNFSLFPLSLDPREDRP